MGEYSEINSANLIIFETHIFTIIILYNIIIKMNSYDIGIIIFFILLSLFFTLYSFYIKKFEYDIVFIGFFSIILFIFLYICTNLIISPYKVIQSKKVEDKDETKISYINQIEDLEYISTYFLTIFSLLILIYFIWKYGKEKKSFIINDKYKGKILITSFILTFIIIGIYFGIYFGI